MEKNLRLSFKYQNYMNCEALSRISQIFSSQTTLFYVFLCILMFVPKNLISEEVHRFH